MEPEYACAVIEDARHAADGNRPAEAGGPGRLQPALRLRLLLQVRPADALHAPGLLTCFGGRREADEDALACVCRELMEELCWRPEALAPCCELWKGSRFIARFFRTAFTGGDLRTEAGHHAVWVPWPALPGLPVSPWHRAVFEALAAGHDRVDLEPG